GVAGGLGLALVDDMHRLAVDGFDPHLCIVLDLDPAVPLARAAGRGASEDRFERKGLAYQQEVRRGFRLLAERSPATHVLIDAGRSVAEVSADVFQAVRERLGLPLPNPVTAP